MLNLQRIRKNAHMRVCNICQGEKSVHRVDMIDKDEGGPNDGGILIGIGEDICKRCINLIENNDWVALGQLSKAAHGIRAQVGNLVS